MGLLGGLKASAAAKSEAVQGVFNKIAPLTAVSWAAYPVVWLAAVALARSPPTRRPWPTPSLTSSPSPSLVSSSCPPAMLATRSKPLVSRALPQPGLQLQARELRLAWRAAAG